MEPVRPYYLASFDKEGETIVARARDLARDLTVSAAAEAVRLREEAAREGREAGIAEGRELGRREESKRLAEGLRRILEDVERHRARLIQESERDVVRLAVAIAEKIVKAEVKRGPAVAERNVRAALRRAVRRTGLEVRLHPDDAKAFAPRPEDRAGVTFVADPAIAPGGCVVRTESGTMDLELRTQLDEIERALLGD